MRLSAFVLCILSLTISHGARGQPSGSYIAQPLNSTQPEQPRWVKGTEVQLMVIREVNSRSAKAGDRINLRVNAPVLLDDKIAIPVGAVAHAEVVSVSGTSAAGGKGQLSIRLVAVETAWGPIKLSGSKGTEGADNTGGVILGVISFGLLGLLNKGGNAVFKGGELITAHIDQGGDPIVEPLEVRP